MSDSLNYDTAYKSYLDPKLWTLIGPGQWRHAEGARLDVRGNRPANDWTLTVGQDSHSGKSFADLDVLLGQLNLRGAGGRRNPRSR
jgi:hypothetical protein